jgi:hypothetical protein
MTVEARQGGVSIYRRKPREPERRASAFYCETTGQTTRSR